MIFETSESINRLLVKFNGFLCRNFLRLLWNKNRKRQNMQIPLNMGHRCLHIYAWDAWRHCRTKNSPHSPSDLISFSCNNTVGLNPCATYTPVNSIIRLTVCAILAYTNHVTIIHAGNNIKDTGV